MIGCSLRVALYVLCCQCFSTVRQCGTLLQIHSLNYGPCSQRCQFLTGSVLQSNITHRQSVAVLSMVYKLRCTIFMVKYMYRMLLRLCGLHTLLWPQSGILMCLLVAEPRSTFIPFSVSLWNDLGDSVFDSVGLAGFKIMTNAFFIGLNCWLPLSLLLCSLCVLSFFGLVLQTCGVVVLRLRGSSTLFLPCVADLY